MIPLIAVVLALFAGATLSLALTPRPSVASWVGAAAATASCGYGVWLAVHALSTAAFATLELGWSIPNGALSFGIDPLSAFFLVPLFALGGLGACYGRCYLQEHAPNRVLSIPWAAYNTMLAGMVLVLIARHALLFLFAWELMSLSAYVLVSFDHHDASVRRASFVYLIATHVGVACLFAMFLLFGTRAQSFEFSAIAAGARPSSTFAGLLFLLGVAGFGAKAGLFPLHVWLPEAHAAAPSHVSAVMSGVLIKMGIYGILRVVLLLGGPQPFFGPLLIVFGVCGAAVGIACALYQRDIKRLLAYSSVENIGLILLGLGTAFWGVTAQRPVVAALGLFGGLLHVWNHAAMKGLMFLGAGSLVHRCHTRDMEQLGGLFRLMPQTATVLVLGATAMAGLPPLNGFVSEWLLYSGLLHAGLSVDGGVAVAILVAVGAVALIGALAALAFTRFIGVALLGAPRSARATGAKESSAWMVVPMLVLAITLVALALLPATAIALFRPVAEQVLGSASLPAQAIGGIGPIGKFNYVLLAILLVGIGIAVIRQKSGRIAEDDTWGCGYLAPSPRIQYSGRAFSELFTSSVLPRSLGPRVLLEPPVGIFPNSGQVQSDTTDPATRGMYEPFFERWAGRFARLRFMQQGILHVYVLYILVALVVALTWSAVTTALGGPR